MYERDEQAGGARVVALLGLPPTGTTTPGGAAPGPAGLTDVADVAHTAEVADP